MIDRWTCQCTSSLTGHNYWIVRDNFVVGQAISDDDHWWVAKDVTGTQHLLSVPLAAPTVTELIRQLNMRIK